MYYRTEAVIIKAFDFKEADQIVTMFTRDLGKVKAIAKGVKKTKSGLRALVQPFCRSELQLTTSGDMYLVTQGRIIDFFGSVREDMERALQALYLLELLDKSVPDREVNHALYDLTLKTLKYIDEHELSPMVLRYFETKLLTLLGYAPVLDHCCGCQTLGSFSFFSPAGGGALCEKCTGEWETRKTLPAAIAALKTLQQNNMTILPRLKLPATVLDEMETILEKYLEYYLERRFSVKELIKDMKLFNL